MMPPACRAEIHVGRRSTASSSPLRFSARGGKKAKNEVGGHSLWLDRPSGKLPRASRGDRAACENRAVLPISRATQKQPGMQHHTTDIHGQLIFLGTGTSVGVPMV